jgi:hypothetical protein
LTDYQFEGLGAPRNMAIPAKEPALSDTKIANVIALTDGY